MEINKQELKKAKKASLGWVYIKLIKFKVFQIGKVINKISLCLKFQATKKDKIADNK